MVFADGNGKRSVQGEEEQWYALLSLLDEDAGAVRSSNLSIQVDEGRVKVI